MQIKFKNRGGTKMHIYLVRAKSSTKSGGYLILYTNHGNLTTYVEFQIKLFDEMVDKRDFLRIINLWQKLQHKIGKLQIFPPPYACQ